MATEKALQIPEIRIQSFDIYLVGTAPLIIHAFPEKSRKEMLAKQMKEQQGIKAGHH